MHKNNEYSSIFYTTRICNPTNLRILFDTFRLLWLRYHGVINVSLIETTDKQLLTYALPNTIICPRSKSLLPLIEEPKPHSKRCVQDYGRSHVIYPSSPALTSLEDNVTHPSTNDVIDGLSCDLFINLSFQDEVGAEEKDLAVESFGLQNPWNSKVLGDALLKFKSHNSEDQSKSNVGHKLKPKIKQYLLLENITSPYRYPCVLDLKMGTRVRENPSPAKLARHVTAIELGARLSGMQLYHRSKNTYSYVNKYYGHNLSVSGLKAKLLEFFSRGKYTPRQTDENGVKALKRNLVDSALVESAVTKLLLLRHAIASLESYRFYSCSMLLIYEGDPEHSISSDLLVRKTSSSASVEQVCKFMGAGDVVLRHNDDTGNSALKSQYTDTLRSTKSLRSDSLQTPPIKSAKQPLEQASGAITRDEERSALSKKTGFVPTGGEGDTKRMVVTVKQTRGKKLERSNVEKLPPEEAPLIDPCLTKDQNPLGQADGVEVRLIDFAHFCSQDPVIHPGPDTGFLYGLDKLLELLRAMMQ